MQRKQWQDIPTEKLGDGIGRQVIWSEKATLARFTFVQGKHVSKHKHESEQITCMLEGSMRMNLGGQELALRAGDVLVIRPWTEHEVWFLEDSVVLDFFSPPRQDWKKGEARYLVGK